MKTRKNTNNIKLHVINGYKVLFVKENNNKLHVECVIRSGFFNEPKHLSGINHLLEHMMVEGWKKCEASCIHYWDNKGYHINASTDKTTMNYYVKGLNHEWKNMIYYITSIINRPKLNIQTMKKEKQAVIDELLTLSTESETNLSDVFNKHFYKLDGLKYGDDWKLQIDNLKHIDIEDVYKMFDLYFNNNNIMFIVVGDFNTQDIYSLFQSKLKNIHTQHTILNNDCFTYNHDILYTKGDIQNTKIKFGFPYVKYYNFIDMRLVTTLLHTILFDELRTNKSIIYDIDVFNEINLCGTSIMISFNIQTTHALTACKTLLKIINNLQTMTFSELNGIKNKEIYNFITDESNLIDYYTSIIYTKSPLYTKNQIIHRIKTISQNKIKLILKEILQIKNALCVYESKNDLKLSWEKLI
jgi:predicted Zn-dependent peptidase